MTTKTVLYMVRHAESPYSEGVERVRGLSTEGKAAAQAVTRRLLNEPIDVFYSSPYVRAIDTLQELADHKGKPITSVEDLRERHFSGADHLIRGEDFESVIRQLFADPDYSLPGGESNRACQERAIASLLPIIREHKGKHIAIGTHGNVMTQMLHYFDPSYDVEFLFQTSKPDIYRMELNEEERLIAVERMWP